MEQQKKKIVRLCSKTYEYQGKFLGHKDLLQVPWLTIQGHWLRRAGFEVGDYVGVQARNGEMIITKENRDGDQGA